MGRIKQNCKICQKEFLARERKERGGHAKYCSMPCYRKAPKSEDMREKLRQSQLKNPTSYWTGKTRSDETKEKISKNRKGKMVGEDNHLWKGDNVGYVSLHIWARRHKGKPEKCVACSGKALDWANISGNYKRDLSDFQSMCRSCHKKLDLSRI